MLTLVTVNRMASGSQREITGEDVQVLAAVWLAGIEMAKLKGIWTGHQ